MENVLATTLFMILFSYCTTYLVGDRLYTMEMQVVQSTTYRYTQAAAKKGEVTATIYEELKEHLAAYGDYKISLSAERIEESKVATLVGEEVINYELRANQFDLLNIHVVSEKPHWFHLLNRAGDYVIVGHAAAYIQ